MQHDYLLENYQYLYLQIQLYMASGQYMIGIILPKNGLENVYKNLIRLYFGHIQIGMLTDIMNLLILIIVYKEHTNFTA